MLAIQTKGRGDYNQWVEAYRLEYSQDCATFYSLLNVDGNNQVRRFNCLGISQSSTFKLYTSIIKKYWTHTVNGRSPSDKIIAPGMCSFQQLKGDCSIQGLNSLIWYLLCISQS